MGNNHLELGIMTQEQFILLLDEESLRKYVIFGKQFLIDHDIKGRSTVGRWVAFAELELKRRCPEEKQGEDQDDRT